MSRGEAAPETQASLPFDQDDEPRSRTEHTAFRSSVPQRSAPTSCGDERVSAVWLQWLSSMASDAEAALAAAIAYRDMDALGRENWLRSLKSDVRSVEVPAIALYAPLLSVETDPERCERLLSELAAQPQSGGASALPNAYCGRRTDGSGVHVLVLPLYLDFVQVLACSVRDGRFDWVRHDPIVSKDDSPSSQELLDGVRLERTPMKAVLDELACAVLSHRRAGLGLPEALNVLADLLGPTG